MQCHAIPSLPRKREPRAISGALAPCSCQGQALGARFRGHDEHVGGLYADFCNEALGLRSGQRGKDGRLWLGRADGRVGLANVVIATQPDIKVWAWFISFGATGAKLTPLLLQYALFWMIITRKQKIDTATTSSRRRRLSGAAEARLCVLRDAPPHPERRRRRRRRAGAPQHEVCH